MIEEKKGERKMGLFDKYAHLKQYKNGVMHCTFNPGGPGVVRIHLIPPRFTFFGGGSYVVILNGYYVMPIGRSWALMLSRFISEVNRYDGKPMTEASEKWIIRRTLSYAKKIYPTISREELELDLYEMLDVIFTVAKGEAPEGEFERLSIRKYAKYMSAPHRMDLMISAMTDEEGHWKCNQKCTFCYASGQKYSGVKELHTFEWKRIINRLWSARVPMVTFTGGEPTQRGDLVKLVKHAEKMVTRVNTNGVNVTEKLAKDLAEAGLDSMQITLYSCDEDIHNSLVGANRWANTVSGIKNAVAAGLDVSINTPLCKKNKDYISTLEFARSLGVRFVTVSGLILTGCAELNHAEYDLSTDELTDIVIRAKKYCDEHEMEIDFTSPGLVPKEILESNGMNVPMCGACLSNMAIAPNGTVVPCQSWLDEDASLGSLLTLTFDEIWNNPDAIELRFMSEDEALSCPFRTGKEKKK